MNILKLHAISVIGGIIGLIGALLGNLPILIIGTILSFLFCLDRIPFMRYSIVFSYSKILIILFSVLVSKIISSVFSISITGLGWFIANVIFTYNAIMSLIGGIIDKRELEKVNAEIENKRAKRRKHKRRKHKH